MNDSQPADTYREWFLAFHILYMPTAIWHGSARNAEVSGPALTSSQTLFAAVWGCRGEAAQLFPMILIDTLTWSEFHYEQ